MELTGRVVLVTGGSGGIGGAIVRSFAKSGISGVAINYRTSANEAAAIASEIERGGTNSLTVQADVRSDHEVRKMMSAVQQHFGRLDILVNNAGLTRWVTLADLEGLTDAIWDEILDVNVKGAFRCTRAAAGMLKEAQGMVINVSSISGVLAPSTISSLAYGTAKAALIYMTRALAVAMAPKVRVNGVAPAFTDTPWMSQHFGAAYREVIAKAAADYPLQRIASPEDIAGAILGLVSGGDFVTGQTLIVDGGLSLT
jgi:3-oxoacyl-[acyl-carrier protein] reductase